MRDINNEHIEIGDTVKTEQPSGGIFKPAKATIGIVIKCPEQFKTVYKNDLFIVYKKMYQGVEIDCYINLKGKINEILVK